MAAPLTEPILSWGVAVRPLAGETDSGDVCLVKTHERGALVAGIDGVGHGQPAVAAAQSAVQILERSPQDPVTTLLRHCHEALAETRGAVITLASLDSSSHQLTWIAVGNVAAILIPSPGDGRRSESVLLRAGVVGYQLPPLMASQVTLQPGDLLVLATDGIIPGFESSIDPLADPTHIAERIMEQCCKGTDDALVLAVRYFGASHE